MTNTMQWIPLYVRLQLSIPFLLPPCVQSASQEPCFSSPSIFALLTDPQVKFYVYINTASLITLT